MACRVVSRLRIATVALIGQRRDAAVRAVDSFPPERSAAASVDWLRGKTPRAGCHVVPTEKSIRHAKYGLDGIDHRLVFGPSALRRRSC